MSSELIRLLLDKTMALPEPRNRQTNPPNRPTKCKTVFVDSQRRDAAGRTLTRSDKDSVFKNSVERNAKPLYCICLCPLLATIDSFFPTPHTCSLLIRLCILTAFCCENGVKVFHLLLLWPHPVEILQITGGFWNVR